MWLFLLLRLLIGFAIVFDPIGFCCHIGNDTYSFDGTKPTELAFQIFFGRIVAEACHKESLECVPSDIWVIVRFCAWMLV